jgi:hypothetical protein
MATPSTQFTMLVAAFGVLVGAGHEHAHEVQRRRDDHHVRADPVHGPEPPAERDDVLDVFDGAVRVAD